MGIQAQHLSLWKGAHIMPRMPIAFEGKMYPDDRIIQVGALYVERRAEIPVMILGKFDQIIGRATSLERVYLGNSELQAKVSMIIHPFSQYQRIFAEMFGEVYTSVFLAPFKGEYSVDSNAYEIYSGEIRAINIHPNTPGTFI